MSDKTTRRLERELARRGTASRNRDYKATYAVTRDHRAASLAYCAGNKWLMENWKYHNS